MPELQIAPRTTDPTLHALCRVTLGCKGAAQGPGGEGRGMSMSSHEYKMIKRQETMGSLSREITTKISQGYVLLNILIINLEKGNGVA